MSQATEKLKSTTVIRRVFNKLLDNNNYWITFWNWWQIVKLFWNWWQFWWQFWVVQGGLFRPSTLDWLLFSKPLPRKLYFEDGTEIQTILQIPRNAEVFGSCFGEKPGTKMTAASAMKISKRQNEISNRLSNSHTTVKIKACKNGSGQFCMILVKKKLDNEYFLQVMEQIRHQLGKGFKSIPNDDRPQ